MIVQSFNISTQLSRGIMMSKLVLVLDDYHASTSFYGLVVSPMINFVSSLSSSMEIILLCTFPTHTQKFLEF